MVGARFTIEGDGRFGRLLIDGIVTGADVRAAISVIERHLAGLDVLIVEGDQVTGADETAASALAALRAACRPEGVVFVLRQPSDSLLLALDHDDFREHLCAGLAAAAAGR